MKRILLKISWEAFCWEHQNLDIDNITKIAEFISHFYNQGYQLAIVIWGGNIYRGSKLIAQWLNPCDSHSMSMLSTVFNALTLKNTLENIWLDTVVLDALHIKFLETYTHTRWKKYLQQWKILICSSGTWSPFFTTDTTGVLRALELQCEAVIKLTKVDGVYNKDPLLYDDAIYFPEIRYDDFLHKNLQVFDATGIIMARDNRLPIYVSKFWDIDALETILKNKKAGTKIF